MRKLRTRKMTETLKQQDLRYEDSNITISKNKTKNKNNRTKNDMSMRNDNNMLKHQKL